MFYLFSEQKTIKFPKGKRINGLCNWRVLLDYIAHQLCLVYHIVVCTARNTEHQNGLTFRLKAKRTIECVCVCENRARIALASACIYFMLFNQVCCIQKMLKSTLQWEYIKSRRKREQDALDFVPHIIDDFIRLCSVWDWKIYDRSKCLLPFWNMCANISNHAHTKAHTKAHTLCNMGFVVCESMRKYQEALKLIVCHSSIVKHLKRAQCGRARWRYGRVVWLDVLMMWHGTY